MCSRGGSLSWQLRPTSSGGSRTKQCRQAPAGSSTQHGRSQSEKDSENSGRWRAERAFCVVMVWCGGEKRGLYRGVFLACKCAAHPPACVRASRFGVHRHAGTRETCVPPRARRLATAPRVGPAPSARTRRASALSHAAPATRTRRTPSASL